MQTQGFHGGHNFNLRLPISVQVGAPTVGSNTVFEEFAILFTTALQQQAQFEDIEQVFSTGALSVIPREQISTALHFFAIDAAQFILSRFLADIQERVAVTAQKPTLGQQWEKSRGFGIAEPKVLFSMHFENVHGANT